MVESAFGSDLSVLNEFAVINSLRHASAMPDQ